MPLGPTGLPSPRHLLSESLPPWTPFLPLSSVTPHPPGPLPTSRCPSLLSSVLCSSPPNLKGSLCLLGTMSRDSLPQARDSAHPSQTSVRTFETSTEPHGQLSPEHVPLEVGTSCVTCSRQNCLLPRTPNLLSPPFPRPSTISPIATWESRVQSALLLAPHPPAQSADPAESPSGTHILHPSLPATTSSQAASLPSITAKASLSVCLPQGLAPPTASPGSSPRQRKGAEIVL